MDLRWGATIAAVATGSGVVLVYLHRRKNRPLPQRRPWRRELCDPNSGLGSQFSAPIATPNAQSANATQSFDERTDDLSLDLAHTGRSPNVLTCCAFRDVSWAAPPRTLKNEDHDALHAEQVFCVFGGSAVRVLMHLDERRRRVCKPLAGGSVLITKRSQAESKTRARKQLGDDVGSSPQQQGHRPHCR